MVKQDWDTDICSESFMSSDGRLNSSFNYMACLSGSWHTLIITTMENSAKFVFDVETHDVLYNTLVPLPHVWRQSRTNNCMCIFSPSVCPQFAQTLHAGLFIQMSLSPPYNDILMKDLLQPDFQLCAMLASAKEARRGEEPEPFLVVINCISSPHPPSHTPFPLDLSA